MSENLDDFLKMLETAPEESSDAPFGLGDKAVSNKITFLKCRAKNFRSIGNNFMEIDFIRSKSTLIVSDDNGSGKSTLAIWAPYFAMTGRPYAPKEKIAALVNSSTKKDCIVELEFNTKGSTWMVRRGYKPSVFEIFRLEEAGWNLIPADAAMGDQQKYLESLLGFDSKIIENVIVLGTDKFVPFIEMDAPSRRHVVETIWDMAIFPIMLDLAKKKLAIIARLYSETEIEFDSKTSELEYSKQVLEEIESKMVYVGQGQDDIAEYEVEINALTQQIPEIEKSYQENIVPLKKTLQELDSQILQIEQSVREEFKEKVDIAKKELQEAEHNLSEALEDIEHNYGGAISDVKSTIEKLAEEHATETNIEKSSLSQQYAMLLEQQKTIDSECEEYRNKIRSEKEDEINHSADALNEKIREITGDAIEASENLEKEQFHLSFEQGEQKELLRRIDVCKAKQISVSEQRKTLNADKEKLDSKLSSLEHIGNCPTCGRLVDAAAIDEIKGLLQPEYDDNARKMSENIEESDRLCVEASELQTMFDNSEANITKSTEVVERLKISISNMNNEIGKLQIEAKNILESTRQKVENIIDIEVHNMKASINSQIENFKTTSKAKLLELSEKHREAMDLLKENLHGLEADLEKDRYAVKSQFSDTIAKARTLIDNTDKELKVAIGEATQDIVSTSNKLKTELSEVTHKHHSDVQRSKDQISNLEKQIENTKTRIASILQEVNTKSADSKTKIKSLESVIKNLDEKLDNLTQERSSISFIVDELGDKAAKAEIIKAYLPYLNSKVNEYLEAMNLFVGFKMNENFDVEFTSPDRKGQTTFSLSKGQLARMNLSVLFALRDVANLKSSVNTNLLVLDEILEALSERGVREVTEMIKQKFTDMNIFVVSQRAAEFTEHFNHTISYGLRGGFTTVL